MMIEAGDVNADPLAGLVIDTVGGTFAPAGVTETLSKTALHRTVFEWLVTARPT